MTTTLKPRRDLYPMGRKFCSTCRCWRLVYEFGPANQRRNPGVLRSACSTCERVRNRIRIGIKNRGKPYRQALPYGPTRQERCKRGHKLEGDNLLLWGDGHRRCRRCYLRWAHSPARREYVRIYEDAKRREAGVPRRNIARPIRRGKREQVMIPAEPFARWLDTLADRIGREATAARTHLNGEALDRFRSRKQACAHIDVIDRALTETGETFLWDLYPELYGELGRS